MVLQVQLVWQGHREQQDQLAPQELVDYRVPRVRMVLAELLV